MIKAIRWWIGVKLVDLGDWIAGSRPYDWSCLVCEVGECYEDDCICSDWLDKE